MAHSGTDRAGDEPLEPEHDESALFPLPPPPLPPFLLDGSELTEWSTSPQLAILTKYGVALMVLNHWESLLTFKAFTALNRVVLAELVRWNRYAMLINRLPVLTGFVFLRKRS